MNGQVTDSVTQVNTKVTGETPEMAMGNLLISTSHTLSTGGHNVTSAQQQGQITMRVATIKGFNTLMSVGGSIVGRTAEGIIRKVN